MYVQCIYTRYPVINSITRRRNRQGKNKSKIENKIFSYKTLFWRKLILKFEELVTLTFF